MTTIIGVDFSGAQSETKSNTWIARGHLDNNGELWLDSTYPIRRDDLQDLLQNVAVPAVAAMDFPFSVPADFTNFLNIARPAQMPAVWEAVARVAWRDFKDRRDEFVNARCPDQQRDCCTSEPMRAGDAIYHGRPNSYSPLHRVNPDMLPMTYRGMCMLHHWDQDNRLRWHIPPMEPPDPELETVTLLELMPREFLRSIDLRFTGYKGGQRYLDIRIEILDNLGAASGVPLHYTDTVSLACRANDDCLDSVVAAVGAAAWALNPNLFHHPTPDELPDAQLEGWIYVPCLLPPPAH